MALVCGEHKDHDIHVGEKVYGGLLVGSQANVAFCERALAAIPTEARSTKVIPGGVNIHTATSKANMGGLSRSLSWSDLEYGRRLFSVSRDDFVRYLPGAAQLLLS